MVSEATSSDRWEYLLIYADFQEGNYAASGLDHNDQPWKMDLGEFLLDAGAQGWELVSVTPQASEVYRGVVESGDTAASSAGAAATPSTPAAAMTFGAMMWSRRLMLIMKRRLR